MDFEQSFDTRKAVCLASWWLSQSTVAVKLVAMSLLDVCAHACGDFFSFPIASVSGDISRFLALII